MGTTAFVIFSFLFLGISASLGQTTSSSRQNSTSSSGIIQNYENKFLSLGVPILAGGGGGILLIAIIVIIVCCYCCKKKKKGESDVEMGSKKKQEGNDKQKGKKEEKKKKEKKEKKKKFELKEFKKSGIEEVDTIFDQVHDILETIHEMTESIEKADNSFLNLEQVEEFIAAQVSPTLRSIVSFIVEDAKKTQVVFELTLEGESVGIAIKGETKSYIATGIEKLNELIKAIIHLVTESPKLVEQLIELGKTAAAFNPQELVDQAEGLGMMEKAKAVINVGTNVKNLLAAPKDIEEFIKSIQETLNIVRETFRSEKN